jgi:hypothetical protein
MKWGLPVFLAAVVLCIPTAQAFQLQPQIKHGNELIVAADNSGWYRRMNDIGAWAVDKYSHPVHETITALMFQCKSGVCPDNLVPVNAPPAVLAGVRWNDNPPFILKRTTLAGCANRYIQLPIEPVCWADIFKAGQRDASKPKNPVYFQYDPGQAEQYALLLRSHFGDLQFLHAMASRPDERAGHTRDKIMMWVEFTWRITTGEFDRGTDMVQASQRMSLGSPTLLDYFGRGETVQLLFFKGEPAFAREFKDFAFGSLLHLVQDSYSTAHLSRTSASGKLCEGTPYEAPGSIEQFYNYVGQNANAHSERDTHNAFVSHWRQEPPPNLVDVGAVLIEMKQRNDPWETARPYFECLFRTLDPLARPGHGGI